MSEEGSVREKLKGWETETRREEKRREREVRKKVKRKGINEERGEVKSKEVVRKYGEI